MASLRVASAMGINENDTQVFGGNRGRSTAEGPSRSSTPFALEMERKRQRALGLAHSAQQRNRSSQSSLSTSQSNTNYFRKLPDAAIIDQKHAHESKSQSACGDYAGECSPTEGTFHTPMSSSAMVLSSRSSTSSSSTSTCSSDAEIRCVRSAVTSRTGRRRSSPYQRRKYKGSTAGVTKPRRKDVGSDIEEKVGWSPPLDIPPRMMDSARPRRGGGRRGSTAKGVLHGNGRKVRINLYDSPYPVLKRVAKELGWKIMMDNPSPERNAEDRSPSDDDVPCDDWTVLWRDNGSFSVSSVRTLTSGRQYRRVNHFPGMQEICLKHTLANHLQRMRKAFPNDYKFFPRTWVLPADSRRLGDYMKKNGRRTILICKAPDKCQGRGIYLTKKIPSKPKAGEQLVVQEYVKSPLLIEGRKFDLRLYIVVTSVYPHFRAFIHRKGLVRLCSVEYAAPKASNLSTVGMHLTNFAVNRKSEVEVKRDLDWFWNWFEREQKLGRREDLWQAIHEVVGKTFLPIRNLLKHRYRACFASPESGSGCFEVLGIDIMITSGLKPLLIELNHLPSFETAADLDDNVKSEVLLSALRLSVIDSDGLLLGYSKAGGDVPAEWLARGKNGECGGVSTKVKKDREDEAKRLHFVERLRTAYEANFAGNFERLIPLPPDVDPVTASDENVAEKYARFERFASQKTSLEKSSKTHQNRLAEVKRKKAERALKEKRAMGLAKRPTQNSEGSAAPFCQGNVEKISAPSSRLYPGPEKMRQRSRIRSEATIRAANIQKQFATPSAHVAVQPRMATLTLPFASGDYRWGMTSHFQTTLDYRRR